MSLAILPELHHAERLERLKALYRWMVLTRAYDEKGAILARLGRTAVYYASTGEEAAVVGTVAALDPADWVFPYYRQEGAYLVRGLPLKAMFGELLGNQADRCLGHQSPIHYSDAEHRVVSNSSPIGSQFSQATGTAMAIATQQRQAQSDTSAVVLAYVGDGGTSSNDFHAGMTLAGVYRVPMVGVCINNQWAISVPRTQQSAARKLSDKAIGYGIPGETVDGNDVEAVYEATRNAVERARAGEGPQFIELETYRQGGHSTADNPTRYRPAHLDEVWRARDPVAMARSRLAETMGWSDADDDDLWEAVRAEINQGLAEAEAAGPLSLESLFDTVYAVRTSALETQLNALRAELVDGVWPADVPVDIQQALGINPPQS